MFMFYVFFSRILKCQELLFPAEGWVIKYNVGEIEKKIDIERLFINKKSYKLIEPHFVGSGLEIMLGHL